MDRPFYPSSTGAPPSSVSRRSASAEPPPSVPLTFDSSAGHSPGSYAAPFDPFRSETSAPPSGQQFSPLGYSSSRHQSQYGVDPAMSRDFMPFTQAAGGTLPQSEFPVRGGTAFSPGYGQSTGVGRTMYPAQAEWDNPTNVSQEYYMREPDSPIHGSSEFVVESSTRRGSEKRQPGTRYHSQRKPSNRDEFDGPHQLLQPPSPRTVAAQERELPHLPTNLDVQEQDEVLGRVNDILSKCAFDFVAKYQFPIPIEPDKRQVRTPADREWTEWVYLLKRLATKRRVPARVLYNNQIKQLVTVLENSLEMRHAAKHQSRPLKDDRNVLQLVSAGTQVAKILKDATAMEYLDQLYTTTELLIQDRKERNRRAFAP